MKMIFYQRVDGRRSLEVNMTSKTVPEVTEVSIKASEVTEKNRRSSRIRKEPLSRQRLCRGFCCVVEAVKRFQRSQRLRKEVTRSRGERSQGQEEILRSHRLGFWHKQLR